MSKPADLGLPTNDLRGYRLVFNVATSTLAVQVWAERGDIELGEVYTRPSSARTYQRVAASSEPNISDQCLITCDAGPYVFFVRNVATKDDVGWGFKFRAIMRLDLRTGQADECMTRVMPAARQWPADLLWGSPDGRILHASVASNTGATVSYAVSRIDLSDETVTPLADLPAIFV